MTENMMTCPECGDEFETVAQEQDLPVQALEQQCPSCDYTVQVSICNYPDGSFEVLAPAIEDDTCHCGSDAIIRRQRTGHPVEGRCDDHVRLHQQAALDCRSSL